MTKTIHIPRGMRLFDQLAQMYGFRRSGREMDELYRLHAKVMEHCASREIPTSQGSASAGLLQEVERGDVVVPSLHRRVHLQSSLWGTIDIPRRFDRERFVGNLGYLECLRELSIRVFKLCAVPKVQGWHEYKGGTNEYVADWRKTLYLIQLSQSERYLSQFQGLEGLDAYAERYFFNNTYSARTFALNLFPDDVFEGLGWHTAATPSYLKANAMKVEERYHSLHDGLLACMRDVHAREPRSNVKDYVKTILAQRRAWDPQRSMKGGMDAIRRFGLIYWSLADKNLDMGEIDQLLEAHGPGYRRMQEIYDEFIRLAEDDLLSTEDLSKIAVQHGLMQKPLRGAITQGHRDVLLDLFKRYAIKVDVLNELLKQNTFQGVVRRIVAWSYLPPNEDVDLLRFVGLWYGGISEHGINWITKQFDDPEHTGSLYGFAHKIWRDYLVTRDQRINAHQERQRRMMKSGAHKKVVLINEGSAPAVDVELMPLAVKAISQLNALEELADEYQDDLDESWFDNYVDGIEQMRKQIKGGSSPDERTVASFAGRLKRVLGRALGDAEEAASLVDHALQQ